MHRWPGCAPGGAPTFLVSPRKVGKRRRPCRLRPCASLRATCGARVRGAAAELTARCALRSNSRGESEHDAGASCGAPTHSARCAPRRSQKGVSIGPSLRSAPTWRLGRAQRWPAWFPTPLWPCREAQGLGRAWAAQHARASCTDSLRLSERSERSERSEFRSAAPGPSIAGCPKRSAGTRAAGSPFLWLLSLARQRKGLRRRAHIPASGSIQPQEPLTPTLSPTGRGSRPTPAAGSSGHGGESLITHQFTI